MKIGKTIKENPAVSFIIFGILIITAIFILEKINGRFWLNDFKVMYLAAEALLNNDPVYGTPFGLGTGFFKYSPFTGLLFVPYTLVSFEIASIIHFFLIGFSALATIILLEKMIRKYLIPKRKKHFLALTAVLFCIILHLIRELHLGNINMMLILLLCISLFFTLESKFVISALLLALVILAKPYFIICLIPYFVNKNYKTVYYSSGFILLFVIVSILLTGISKGMVLYQGWIEAMLNHNEYLYSNHTLFSLMKTYVGIVMPAKFSMALLLFTGLISSVSFWLIYYKTKLNTNSPNKTQALLIVHFFLIIAIIPNILITDTEHFLLSLPLIAILLFHLKKDSILAIVLFILMIFMYEGNSTDLLGKGLSDKFEEYGILGIGNLIIIGTIIYWFLRNKSRIINREQM